MDWVNNVVFGLIEFYDTNNIYELLDYLSIKIIKLDKENVLLQNHNAFYCRGCFHKEVIFIRKDLQLNYEKFILSHELGHALLHTKVLDSRMCNKGKLERQANYFALKLSNIEFDKIELDGMTLEQIASCLELPLEPLKQVISL